MYPFCFYVGNIVVPTFQKISILFYFYFETNNSPFLQTGFLASNFKISIDNFLFL